MPLLLTLVLALVAGCASKPPLTSRLSKEEVATVVASHRDEIKSCYQELLKENPNASGKVVLHFVVDPDGKVAEASIKDRTIASEDLGSCVLTRFRNWEFPKAGQPTEVLAYPIYMGRKKG